MLKETEHHLQSSVGGTDANGQKTDIDSLSGHKRLPSMAYSLPIDLPNLAIDLADTLYHTQRHVQQVSNLSRAKMKCLGHVNDTALQIMGVVLAEGDLAPFPCHDCGKKATRGQQ